MSTSSSLVNPYLGIMFVAIAPLSIYLVLYYATGLNECVHLDETIL